MSQQNQSNQRRTIDDVMAELEQTKAKLAALEEQQTANITADVPDFGKGALALRNVTGRMPLSLHPAGVPKLIKAAQIAVEALKDPKKANALRIGAFAYEYASKVTGFDDIPEQKSKSAPKSQARLAWEAAWTTGKDMATKDVMLYPKNEKWESPESVLKSIKPITIG